MLGNFTYANPTKLYFGDEARTNLEEALRPFGKKVLLAYGGYHVFNHDEIVEILRRSL